MKVPAVGMVVAIGLGAIGGAFLRVLAQRLLNISAFSPYGTIVVNILGSFLIGLIASYFRQRGYSVLFHGLTAGFCGSFTTFSSISLETLDMLRLGQASRAALYVLVTVLGGFVAVGLGWIVGRGLAS